MSDFELVRSGCGWPKSCALRCAGPGACRARFSGDLEQAIRRGRELMHDDPLAVVEVRSNGTTLCTLGYGWTSHPLSAARPGRNAAEPRLAAR